MHTLHLVLRDHPPQVYPSLSNSAATSSQSNLTPSSIPRPSSVPTQNPLRPLRSPANTDQQAPVVQTNPFRNAPNRPLTPRQVPQAQVPLSQLLQHGNVEAQVNVNGVPVNLPMEVINNLLNQQFNATAQVQLLQALQNQQQATAYQQQGQNLNNSTSESGTSPAQAGQAAASQSTPTERTEGNPNFIPNLESHSGLRALHQQLAHGQQARAAAGRHGIGDSGSPRRTNEAPNRHLHPPSPTQPGEVNGANASLSEQPSTAGVNPQVTAAQQPSAHSAPGAAPNTATAAGRQLNMPAPGQLPFPFPLAALQNAQLPQGQSFTMTFNTGSAAMPQIPGFPHGLPQLPMFPPQLQPQLPITHNHLGQMRTATPSRPRTPHLAPPAGTRSVSPSRLSRGARPDQSLQSHIDVARSNLDTANRLLDVLASERNSDGTPAPPLSSDRVANLRSIGSRLIRDVESIQRELFAITESMPAAVSLPEYTQARSSFRTLYEQVTQTRRRIDEISSVSLSRTVSNVTPTIRPAPTTSSDLPTSAANPELRLLTNPSGQPTALLIGPGGRYTTPPLPMEILYALFASQLPHEQLIQEFRTIMREAANLVMGNSARTGQIAPDATTQIQSSLLTPTPTTTTQVDTRQQQQQPAAAAPVQPQAEPQQAFQNPFHMMVAALAGDPLNPPAHPAADAAQQPGANGAAADAAGQAAAGAGGDQNAAAAAAANRPPDEIRDILAPIVRNLWLLMRIGIFFYFFSAGGRPSWRLILLALGAVAVWAIQNGWLGGAVGADGLRRHFEGLFGLDAARRDRPGPDIRPNRRVSDSERRPASRAGQPAADPNPENAARRMVRAQDDASRNRVLGHLRALERTVALFLASLWPGVGENVVRVQEQRRRDEERRAQEAEVERKRKEEEEKKSIEEAAGVGPAGEGTAADAASSAADLSSGDGVTRVNKGKAKASAEEVEKQEAESLSPTR